MLVTFANNTLTNIFGKLGSSPNRTDELDPLTESHVAHVVKSVSGGLGVVLSLIVLLVLVRKNMEAVERILRQLSDLLTALGNLFRAPPPPVPQPPPVPRRAMGLNLDDEEKVVAEWQARLAQSALHCHLYSDVATLRAHEEYV